MGLTGNINRLAGILLLLLAAAVILEIAFGIAVSDADGFDRAEIRDLLIDIDDNRAMSIISVASAVAIDSFIGLAVAAALFLVFRERDRALALLGLIALVGGTLGNLPTDASRITLIFLADDFVSGGVTGVAAESEVTLQTARAVMIFGGVAGSIAITALGVGLLSFGALIAFSRGPGVTPPKWIGYFAIVAGITFPLTWLLAVTEAAFVFFLVSLLATLLWLIILGIWLLTKAPEGADARTTTAA